MFTSSSPLYVQLKDYITRYIENELQYNDRIPSEFELMDKYCVSRTTVRKAIDELVQEGKLYKKQGLGTYVSGEKVEQGLSDLSSCTYELKKLGFDPYYTLLDASVVPSNVVVASNLQIDIGENVFHLVRISNVEGEPLNVTYSYIPYTFVNGIEKYDFVKNSLYKVLKEEFQIELVKSIRSVEAILCNEKLSKDLKINEGTAILKFNGQVTGKMASGKIVMVEYFRTYYRTDRVKFHVAQTTDILS
ncbi:MAG: GntR family transcriptional regulator [Vagococcus sp.]